MSVKNRFSYDDSRRWSYNGSVDSQRKSACSSHVSLSNDSFMELTDEHVLHILDQAIDSYENFSTMNSRRNLPQIPTQSTPLNLSNNNSQLFSRSAIEDLFEVFENNAEFITMGKRLLNKKRKLEQLRAQLNLPENLSSEDTVKLLQLRERLKAKRRLPTIFIEPENKEFSPINRKPSTSMPDLTATAFADTTNQSSLFDLNASLNSSVYRKRRRKSLFRSTLSLMKQVGPEFVVKPNSKIEKILVPSRNPSECICNVIVLLPNNNRVQVCCKPDVTVRIIHETIISYVDLIEHNLFGLTILIDSEYCFPSMDLKVSKLINDSKWKIGQIAFVMQLKIKYFVNDIALLRHFLTQHFFYLQFRQMVLADMFQLTNEQKLSFASLAFQAEYGYSNDNQQSQIDFIVEYYASNDLINNFGISKLRQEIVERQRFYGELNDVQAERMFVENVMKLDDYGYHMYKLYKDVKHDDIYLVGIRLRDISIWHLKNRQRNTKSTYDWDHIEQIAYDKKSFSIILKRQINEGKIKYLTNNSKKGKYLFELCYDTYAYTKSLLLRHNSRYSLLNEPINEVEFTRNGSDADSIDLNPTHSRSRSQENIDTFMTNTTNNTPMIVYEVDLYKDNNNSLGMSLMGDSTAGIFIKSVNPSDGSAAKSGKIRTGDRLLSYNGKNVNGMTVQEVAEALSLAPNPCRLKLSRHENSTFNRRDFSRRPMSVDANGFLQQQEKENKRSSNILSTTWSPETYSNTLPSKHLLSNESILTQASDLSSARDIKSAVFPVTIDKSGHNSLGFLVVGGLDSEIEDHGIYVKSITPSGAASKSKLLMEGDKVLEVNGYSLARVTHSEAVDLFRRSTGPKCHLLVQRLIFPNQSRSPSTTNENYSFVRQDNTFEVLVNRGQNGLGLSLGGGASENKPIEVIDIYPNQPAALSGQLEIGDVILSINDSPMYNRNIRDVPSIIGDSTRHIKLLICRPDRREYQNYLDRRISNGSHSIRPNDGLRDLPPKSPSTKRFLPNISTKVKRGEVFAVIMYKEKDSGFGFTLSAGSTSIGYPHIRSVLREPALSAGLKHWDRILSINDFDCQTISHRDLVARLRYSPTGPVHFIIYRPRIDEIVHAKEKSRQLQNASQASMSVGDQSGTSNSAPPSPTIPPKSVKSEFLAEPIQYEKIQIQLPKAPQGTYGIGLSQIDPEQHRGGIFVCALQPNGIAEKDGRLRIDDRLLCINDQNTNQMTYREVVEALKATTKKGVSLLIVRPISAPSNSNKDNIVSDKEIFTKRDETEVPSTATAVHSSIIDKLIPHEKPKLAPLTNPKKPTTQLASESNEAPASDEALKTLIERTGRPVIPTYLDLQPNQIKINEEKKKESPVTNIEQDEDASEIKTPTLSPLSPEQPPAPPVLELKPPITSLKPLTSAQSTDITKRTQYYQQAATNETLVLNAGVAEKVENLTKQLIEKISTPAITMDTATLMDESREIEIKLESNEYLEEFRALKAINEHEPIELSAVAIRPENKSLNRFQNIVPYDFNRVVLSTKPDYINASHIAIPIGEKSMKYIICPPPVSDSINDFWQMIVEEGIKCLVGIFNEQDLKKMKCPTYWPGTIKSTMTLSPFLSITLFKQRQLNNSIDIKEFVIHVNEQPKPKQEYSIIFLTYTTWPTDEKTPTDIRSFLSFIHLAHSYQTNEVPLLIHCNTGVGRTGCTLLISLFIIKMIRGRALDIYSMAKECRRQRSGLIQTEQQYRFIYECALEALSIAIENSIMRGAL